MLIFCLKHTLTLEDDVDVWLAKLVQGGYIPSAFHPTTHIPITSEKQFVKALWIPEQETSCVKLVHIVSI